LPSPAGASHPPLTGAVAVGNPVPAG